MFTGLVTDRGLLEVAARTTEGARLRVTTALAAELHAGDSIAVNGVCLTAAELGEGWFDADVMAATLRATSLGALPLRAHVNLELPLRATDRLAGHVVQGHVDGIGRVEDVREEGFARLLRVAVEPSLLRYVVEKGSIALDGVSLTVVSVDGDALTVALIPETRERTTLGAARPGDVLNVEVDVLAKHLEKLTTAV